MGATGFVGGRLFQPGSQQQRFRHLFEASDVGSSYILLPTIRNEAQGDLCLMNNSLASQ